MVRGVERLFHIRPFECPIANLHGLMLRNGKADSRKGRLRHQAGRCPQAGFVRGTGGRFDPVEQPPEQASALALSRRDPQAGYRRSRYSHRARCS